MAKTATRAQSRNARRAARNAAARGGRTTKPKLVMTRERSGLEWLVHKKRITHRQASAGKRYGVDYRIAATSGLNPLRSCLNDEPGGAGQSIAFAVYETEAVDRLARARGALSHQADMIAACDLICGRQLTPWQVIGINGGSQRDVERLQVVVALALDLLDKHYRGTA